MLTVPTQVRRPWRSTVRTTIQAAIGACVAAPLVYGAATQHDPAAATGWAGGGLLIAGAVTRVAALPAVEVWLRRFVPWLAADPAPAARAAIPTDQPQGDAHRAGGV